MKTYDVTIYYHTHLTLRVEAESKAEALAVAERESRKECYKQRLYNGLLEDSGLPDVYEQESDEDWLPEYDYSPYME